MFWRIAFLIAGLACAASAQPYAVSGSFSDSNCGYESFLSGEIHRPGACIPVTGVGYAVYDCSDMDQLKQRTFSDIECTNAITEWQNVNSTCARGSISTFTSKRCVANIPTLGYMLTATVLYSSNASCLNNSDWIEASVYGSQCEPNGEQSYSFGCSATHEIYYGCTDSQCSNCQGSATPLATCRPSETKVGKFTAQRCFLTPLPPRTAAPKAVVPPTAKTAPTAVPSSNLSPQFAPASIGVNQPQTSRTPSDGSAVMLQLSLVIFVTLMSIISNSFM